MIEQNDRGGVDPFAVVVPPEVAARHRPPVYPREIRGYLGALVREHAGAIVAARAVDGRGFVFLDLRGPSVEVAALSTEATDERIPKPAEDVGGVLSFILSDAAEQPAAVRLVVVTRRGEDEDEDRVAVVSFATPEDVRAALMSGEAYWSGLRLWDLSPAA